MFICSSLRCREPHVGGLQKITVTHCHSVSSIFWSYQLFPGPHRAGIIGDLVTRNPPPPPPTLLNGTRSMFPMREVRRGEGQSKWPSPEPLALYSLAKGP